MIPHTLVCEEETVERTENIKNTFIFPTLFPKHQHRQIVFFSNFANVKVFPYNILRLTLIFYFLNGKAYPPPIDDNNVY